MLSDPTHLHTAGRFSPCLGRVGVTSASLGTSECLPVSDSRGKYRTLMLASDHVQSLGPIAGEHREC